MLCSERDRIATALLGFSSLKKHRGQMPTCDKFIIMACWMSASDPFLFLGATILSENGEVISVASIRAPAKSSNPTLHDENKVQPGYAKYKNKIQSWGKFIKNLTDEDNKRKKLNGDERNKLIEIDKFIKDILDFHPCTHAEISAIIDTAKVGVSIRNSTPYTTTFPCHLCAKDIINAGIDRVVYLEAYPKSKNKELYPNLIDFENNNLTSEKTSFEFYCGISPKRFLYAYSLENKAEKKEIPLLQFEIPKYYLAREDDVLSHFKSILEKKECKKTIHLCNLLHHKK
jgi:deoxycytidylate deaminase